MAYPTKNFSSTQIAFDAQVVGAKASMESMRVAMAAGNVPVGRLLALRRGSIALHGAITAHKDVVANTAGFAAFVAADKGVTVPALSTAVNDLLTAVAAVKTAVDAALPVGTGGYLLIYQLSAGTDLIDRMFTSVETASLQTALATVVAAIG